MNWITKFIKPKIKSLFEKRSSKIEENLWTTCGCKNLIYKEDLESNLKCCPKCGAHHKLSCKERFGIFFDNKEYDLIETPLPQDDPLKFEDNKKYSDRLKSARKITKQNDPQSTRLNVKKIISLDDLINKPINSISFKVKNIDEIDTLSKMLKKGGDVEVNINVVSIDKAYKIKLKDKRIIDRKTVNLIKNQGISTTIH